MSNYNIGIDQKKPKGWKTKFQHYFDPKKKKSLTNVADSCEYIIEKLAVKCVRASVIVTSDDNLSYSRTPLEAKESQVSFDSVASSSSREQTTKNFSANNFKKFSTLSKKISTFKNNKAINDKKFEAMPSVSSPKQPKKIQGNIEIINRFTAFHPHLKECDRPPKEPVTLNIKENQRSFAEELSEMASRKNKSLNISSDLENNTMLSTKMPSTSGQPSM